MNLNILPKDVISKILLYLECPNSKLIKDEIYYYENDHNWDYTKMYKRYFIKNIMSFSNYYFDRRNNPEDYLSYEDRIISDYYDYDSDLK
jgi:hypothetical protein